MFAPGFVTRRLCSGCSSLYLSPLSLIFPTEIGRCPGHKIPPKVSLCINKKTQADASLDLVHKVGILTTNNKVNVPEE